MLGLPPRRSSALRLPPSVLFSASLLIVGTSALFLTKPSYADDANPAPAAIANGTLAIAWNDLGMHCMDPDYSVFALLPPFNDLKAQLIVAGKLKNATGYSLEYKGAADASGSINTSSIGKTNFWSHVQSLFGVALPPDHGLAGHDMPGPANTPQPMAFDGTWNWFAADGVPITPYDDAATNNTYPLLGVTAKDVNGNAIASTSTVVPVSDEMDCSKCHSSGSSPYAMPSTGWVFASNPVVDYRLNILRLHDEHNAGNPAYTAALQTLGFDSNGLYATATTAQHPILCAACHLSNALPGSGLAGISALTSALHGKHATVLDSTGVQLDSISNRSSCYECHPGSVTRCLRGAMGSAVAADGTLSMQCQDCHGSMSKVANPARVGWLDQPSCQECHSGTAVQNSGSIRFTSVFDTNGNPHVPANLTYATNANVPAAGFDLYRFSTGHGGLKCEACHGATHAEYPASEPSDNQQSIALQGHVGMLVECQACHGTVPNTVTGGPHGMHSIGQGFVNSHGDTVEAQGSTQCRVCHGTTYTGTVLSFAQADRTFNTKFGTKTFFRGAQIGCYACHNGPNSGDAINNAAPVVTSKSLSTPNDVSLPINLTGTDANNNPLTYRIVSQPQHGTVGLVGSNATYLPEVGFVGSTSFTFAAFDGKANSNLATVTVNVLNSTCHGEAKKYGFGCPGSGGALPSLALTGCPTPGGNVTVALAKGLGGSNAVLVFGLNEGVSMVGFGCVLRVAPLLPITVSVPLSAGGPGQGSFAIPATVPVGAVGTVTLQAFVIDPGTAAGFSATNGLSVSVQ